MVFSTNVVLGNANVSMPMAAVISGLIITGFGYVVPIVVAKSGVKVKNDSSWAGIFWAGNVVIVWVLKRFALILGLGVSSLLYVALLGVILTVAQFAAARATGAMGKGKK